MKPRDTLYRLARPGGEFNKLYAMVRRSRYPMQKLEWPVVVAVRDGDIIGFIATHPRDDAIVAGPLLLKDERNPFVFMRLVQAYENVLQCAGVKSYLFNVEKSNFSYIHSVQAVGVPLIAEDDNTMLFKREL